MTTTQAGIVLRHVRGLVTAEQASRAPDRQLLERFAARREEAAFAALVRRHGPLVLGVCRRVLHQEQDAEDAFQATFLALARNPGAVGERGSVGGWLHRVAYRTAVKARARSAARRGHERRADRRPPADPLAEVTGRDVIAAVDDELQRLPEQQRAPLVLCYMEGLTGDDAARRLGWSVRTLKRRLAQGRECLRRRLTRRGLALPAALLAAGMAQGARAAVPAALATTAVKAGLLVAGGGAVAGIVSARAAALAAGAVRAMAAGKARAVGALLLALALLGIGAGLLASGPSPAADEGEPKAPAAGAKAADNKKEMSATGRVLDAGGEPVAGAEVAVVAAGWSEERVLARGRAGSDGRFRLTLADPRARWQEVYGMAGKDGHGLAWEKMPAAAAAWEVVLRLPPEKVVRGRAIDLQGLPAVGVEVRTPRIPAWGDFAAWPEPATTDRDGKFVVRGLSRDFDGCLSVEGADFAPQLVQAKPGAADGAQELSLTLLPAHVLEGAVIGEDTGEPIPGARVKLQPGGDGQSDEKGRYRIKLRLPDNSYPLPPGGAHRVWVTAPDDQPYLRLETTVAWPKGAVRHEAKFVLKRGVLVRGKVTEAASGAPVAGAVVHDAAHLWTRNVMSGEDGTFQVAVAPGRGHLLVKGPNNDYVATPIPGDELAGGKPGDPRLYPDAVVPLALKAGAGAADVAVRLRRGVTIRGRLLGPDGKPAAGAVLLCWNQLRPDVASWFDAAVAVRDGRFELRGCDPEKTYPVHFLDAEHKTGATVALSGKQAGEDVSVRLVPCGEATTRLVDAAGKPVANQRLDLEMVVSAADAGSAADVDHLSGPPTDAEGRVTFPALIPGATYRIVEMGDRDDPVKCEFKAESGKTIKLPDVVRKKQ
jgi:RNA polymerase sigma factor (sigma-70 family)